MFVGADVATDCSHCVCCHVSTLYVCRSFLYQLSCVMFVGADVTTDRSDDEVGRHPLSVSSALVWPARLAAYQRG